ncbi:MAG: response regulator [Deltaproteobacteria bacterium]|nr:response regulator [Deltaproteobacteria bacterium]
MTKPVLVIDDSDDNLEIIRAKLTHVGYRIKTALDGETGLHMAREFSPGVILCDIMLPRMDGWEVLSRLKADPATKDIPVILMTAYTTIQYQGERSRALELGAAEYLKKPMDLNEMTRLVGEYLGR